MARKSGYKLIDEIEPVGDNSWAMHPTVAFYASMAVDTPYLAVIGVANSFLLGHPRRKHHLAVAVAAVLGVYAVEFVTVTFFPKVAWKYVFLLAVAMHLWLGYYLTEEQQWAAEMFEFAGGKVLSWWTTVMFVQAIGRMLVVRWMRMFLRVVR